MLQLKEALVWEPQHRRWRHPRIPSGLSVDGADCGVGERASVGALHGSSQGKSVPGCCSLRRSRPLGRGLF